ncbi:cytochrome b [Pseudogemmobacter sonorensis]|uniref:cytochrome b n=1 Tax=Pseudogemmobacter sonorensis TaxID=2989681 RepID=UPI0036B2FF2A
MRQIEIFDRPAAYGLVTRLLHWSIAGLILWQFTGMILRGILGRHPVSGFFVGLHQPIGALLFVMILARILWALVNRRRRPPHGAGLIGLAARLGHFALYAVMLVVPLSALLRAFGQERAFAPFGITVFPARDEPVAWMVTLGDALHGEVAWLLLALILGHVAMVIVHEWLWRDRTLARMAGRG